MKTEESALRTLLHVFAASAILFCIAGISAAGQYRLLKGRSPIIEPYPALNGGAFVGPAVPESSDPLVGYRWKSPNVGDNMQTYLLGPVLARANPPKAFDNLESITGDRCDVLVRGIGSIRFDFGVESAAWLEFDSPDLSGTVEMSISEYNEPGIVNVLPEHRIKTLQPKRHGNTYRLELNKDVKEIYEGVRFGWIHVRTFDKPWRITAVRLVCRIKPANYQGSFSCSDAGLTRIWYAGAYDVKVNLMRTGIGSILIDRGDRLVWTVECGSSLQVALATFGNWDLLRRQLVDTGRSDANGIEVNVLHWIIGLLDYYRYTGDTQTMEELLPKIVAKLDHANAIYPDPRMIWFAWDERAGNGFDEPNLPECKHAYRMTFLRVCRDFAKAMDAFGRYDLRDKYQDIADRRTAELRKMPKWCEGFGIFAGSAAVNAGITTPEEQEEIFRREFSDRAGRMANCPFDVYYCLQALARMGRHDAALAMARDCWGGQIECGATTFFEVYRPEWNQFLKKNDPIPSSQSGYTSLAHTWGSGITSWLSAEVLGIKPAATGFAKVDILPHLGRTLTAVAGSVPTPHGPVAARFDVSAGSAEVSIPPATVGHIGIPLVERNITRLEINGKLAWDGRFHAVPGIGDAGADKEFVHLLNMQPGKYTLTIAYEGKTLPFVDVPFVYPVRFVKEDSETHGNWGGVYGRDGYVLFNYDGTGKDRRQLPSYVEAVTPARGIYGGCRNARWAAAVTDDRGLAAAATNLGLRNVGYLYGPAPDWRGVTMTVDVAVRANTKYQLALYVIDWDNNGRREAVEVLDLQTRKLVAPICLVRDFTQGNYLVYQCDRSVRLRINHVRGDNAVLSGLFFDHPPEDHGHQADNGYMVPAPDLSVRPESVTDGSCPINAQ